MITGSTVAVTAQAVMISLGTLLAAAALGYAVTAWVAGATLAQQRHAAAARQRRRIGAAAASGDGPEASLRRRAWA